MPAKTAVENLGQNSRSELRCRHFVARAWLDEQVAASNIHVSGIYLGLDTLNMAEGTGSNVEVGMSSSADPSKLDMAWIYKCHKYGERHLIESLVSMKQRYEGSDVSDLADYMLFLGYSGLVLLEAVETADIGNDFIAVWGFHDGDIYFLARKSNGKTERLVRL